MKDNLYQQLALYSSVQLQAEHGLSWISDDEILQLQKGSLVIEQWLKPIRWGAVLDTLANKHSTSKIEPITLAPNYIFDVQQGTLQRNNESIKLTDKEQATLLYLYRAGRSVTREELVAKVWEYHADVQTHTVETLIWRLRQKLETNPENPQLLITTPQGYSLSR